MNPKKQCSRQCSKKSRADRGKGQDAGRSWVAYCYRSAPPMRCTFRCQRCGGSGLAQDRLEEIFPELTRYGRSPSLMLAARTDPTLLHSGRACARLPIAVCIGVTLLIASSLQDFISELFNCVIAPAFCPGLLYVAIQFSIYLHPARRYCNKESSVRKSRIDHGKR